MTHVQEHFARDAREASDTNTGITRPEGARVSERRICRVLDQPRSTQRYVHVQRDGDEHLIRRMHELVREHPRRG